MGYAAPGHGKQPYHMYVSLALQLIRDKYPDLYIIHYMDDILLATKEPLSVLQAFGDLQMSINTAGLQIAPEKAQQHFPYQY